MEDAYTAVPFLLEVPVPGGAQEDLIPPRIAPQVRLILALTARQAAPLPAAQKIWRFTTLRARGSTM